jgi:HK97 family phage prohead protease
MKENREIRSTSAPSVTGRRVSGVAVAFRSPSRPLYENGKRFIEVILPEAITDELIQRCDIRALVDHDRARLLARSNKGKGTLKLNLTEFGLEYSFEAPHTADGDYVVEMVKRGDIEGSSFAFSVADGGERWEKRKDGTYIRYISKIRALYDVTITADPAYPSTSVDVRRNGGRENDWRKSLHRAYKKAGIPFTPKEKLEALRKDIDDVKLRQRFIAINNRK